MAQAARCLAKGSMARVSERWRFPSLLRIQTAPGVHSAYYKMSTGGLMRPSIGLAILLFLAPWPIMGIPFTMDDNF